LEEKRIEVSLHAAAKAQAAQTFQQPTPGDGGNADRLTPRRRTRSSNTEKNARSMKRTRHIHTKSPSPRHTSCSASIYMATSTRWA
jgi:hypothetical protein